MNRIKFEKGYQRNFFEEVFVKINSPSLRELSRRLEINYSTLKNYFNEERLIPESLFNILIEISGIKKGTLDFQIFKGNWGKVKGGKISKR